MNGKKSRDSQGAISMMSSFGKQWAMRIEAAVEEHFVDPNGVVYSFLDKATRRPPTDAFFVGAETSVRVPGVSDSDFHMHENCGMCSGAYMQAMILKHQGTGDPSALARARRCFGALRHIYEIGKELEPGFFPKIYGGRFSPQTSTDQVLYAVSAMDNFHSLANPDEKKAIGEMIPAMVEFWVKRQYRLTYYCEKDMLWPLDRFPSLLALAGIYSGREIFKTEYERLLPLTEHTDCSRIGRKLAGEVEPSEMERDAHSWLVSHSADAMTMAAMQYDLLLRNSPNDPMRGKWLAALRQMWDESKLTLAPDGRCYTSVLVGMDDMKPRRTPVPSGGYPEPHGAESSWSTMLVRGGLLALPYLPERRDEIVQGALATLSALDVDDFTYYDEPERFRPELRYKTRMLSGDAIANWLWAYWLMVAQEPSAQL